MVGSPLRERRRASVAALVLAVVVAAVLAAALVPAGADAEPAAGARSLAYWFYQGNVPTAAGDRSVRKVNDCCNSTQWIRLSWTTGTHDMNFLNIDYSGNWSSVRAYASDGYDQYLAYSASSWHQGGCQNPSGLSTVWVNCHEGNTQ